MVFENGTQTKPIFKGMVLGLVLVSILSACGENQTQRTPKATLIDLLSHLDVSLKQSDLPDDTRDRFIKERDKIKQKIMTHDLTLERTRDYFKSLQNETALAPKATELLSQLSSEPDYQELWQDFYGRAFDSAFAKYLVEHPPKKVQEVMTTMGKGLSSLIKREINKIKPLELQLESELFALVTHKDPRFWFPKAWAFKQIQKDGPRGAVTKMITYLKQQKRDGIQVISVPYSVTKVGLALKDLKRTPLYLQNANKIYPFLHLMVKDVRYNRRPEKGQPSSQQVLSRAGGITLKGTPDIISEPWMDESQKWTDIRSPKLEDANKGLIQAQKALRKQLEHGVTWASGMSGSTNILMHAWNWLNNNDDPDIQLEMEKEAFFLAAIMFLIYDGGHSLAEPLWAASQIDNELGLNFNLSDSTRVDEFIPDFNRFLAIYDGKSYKNVIERAFDFAFEQTIEYFRKYSSFRNEQWAETYPAEKTWDK